MERLTDLVVHLDHMAKAAAADGDIEDAAIMAMHSDRLALCLGLFRATIDLLMDAEPGPKAEPQWAAKRLGIMERILSELAEDLAGVKVCYLAVDKEGKPA